MSRPMLKSEAQAWMAGWALLRERQRVELLEETYEKKFRALAFLMASVDLFDLSSLDAEDAMARQRWATVQSRASKS